MRFIDKSEMEADYFLCLFHCKMQEVSDKFIKMLDYRKIENVIMQILFLDERFIIIVLNIN